MGKTSSGDGWQEPGRHLVLALNPVLIPSEAALIASRVYTHLGRQRVQFLFDDRFELWYLQFVQFSVDPDQTEPFSPREVKP